MILFNGINECLNVDSILMFNFLEILYPKPNLTITPKVIPMNFYFKFIIESSSRFSPRLKVKHSKYPTGILNIFFNGISSK